MSAAIFGIVFLFPLLISEEPHGIGSKITKLVSIQHPRVPALAGVQGEVVLKFRISADGEAQILEIKGKDHLLEQAAVNCLSLWRFQKSQSAEGESTLRTLHFTFKLKGVCLKTSCATHFEVAFPDHVLVETSAPHWQPEVVPQAKDEPKRKRVGQGVP